MVWWRTRESGIIAGVLAFALGVLVSAGVVMERLRAGDERLAVALNLGTLAFAVASMWWLRRLPRRTPRANVALAQAGSALVGVFAVHVVLALTHPDAALRETPAQWVNDVTLIAALLLLVWSFVARSPMARLLTAVSAFGLVLAYHATAAMWHVDAISFPALTVQQFVFIQVLVTAAGLLLFDWFGSQPEPS